MNIHNVRGGDRKEEKPPHSRLFVVCSKQMKSDDLKERFEPFGEIEDLHIPKDRNTGESKGVAYIKFAKTSSAAAAIQEMHMKTFNNEPKPIKVMIAVNKNESPTQNDNENKYRRLFIKVPKDATENDLRHHFSQFGNVDSIRLQRDKVTDVSKGFAYVQYKTFYDAAKGFEECDGKYRPVFATPRDELKRSRNSLDLWTDTNVNMNAYSCPKYSHNLDRNNQPRTDYNKQDIQNSSTSANYEDFNTVVVVCSPQLPQKYIQRLFDLVPGMVQCQYSVDTYNGISKAFITYDTGNSATFAIERLNNYEFPSGEIISVKPNKNPLSKAANDLTDIVNNFKNAVDSGTPDLKQLADVIAQASSLIKAASLSTGHNEPHRDTFDTSYCGINLPPLKPLADYNSRVAQRLFIICKPQPLPPAILQDIFCRFGDLIHVSIIPNKTFGFAKYASAQSAQEAIRILNGAFINGARFKVMEADDKPNKEEIMVRVEQRENTDYNMDSKRMKLD